MYIAPLDERYLDWLYGQVANVKVRPRTRTFWSLFRQLHKTIFVAIVPHDENRIADARDLKYEFLTDTGEEQGDLEWLRSPCSMLELILILARQLAFEMDDHVEVWFWHLLEVLGLERFTDKEYDDDAEQFVGETLERVIWRHYEPDGSGGLFPLRHPDRDQTKVELWYQLNQYLMENF